MNKLTSVCRKIVVGLKGARARIHASKAYHACAHPVHSVCHLTYFWLIAAHYPYYQIAMVLLVIGAARFVIDGEA